MGVIDGAIDRYPIDLSFMVSECERLAWGEVWGEPEEKSIGLSSMASKCERPRKRRSVPTGSIAVKKIFYAKLNAIRVHLTPP